MAEWPKAHAWKVCIPQRIEGSNPSLSATTPLSPRPIKSYIPSKHWHLSQKPISRYPQKFIDISPLVTVHLTVHAR